jgi:hypothetical protein
MNPHTVPPLLQVFWFVVVVFGFVVVAAAMGMLQDSGRLNKGGAAGARASAKAFAETISRSHLRVRSVSVPGMLVLSLRTDVPEIEDVELYFLPAHPSFAELSKLVPLEVIYFEYLADPLSGAEPTDATAYLRLVIS